MAFAPGCHLVYSLGRIPAFFIGALGGDRIIDVADGAHPRKQADLVAGQFVRITGAIDFFMMVQANVE